MPQLRSWPMRDPVLSNIGRETKAREERYDNQLNELEMAVKASQMTLSGALARAFILGMNYQAECNQESAENAAEGLRIEARERE